MNVSPCFFSALLKVIGVFFLCDINEYKAPFMYMKHAFIKVNQYIATMAALSMPSEF